MATRIKRFRPYTETGIISLKYTTVRQPILGPAHPLNLSLQLPRTDAEFSPAIEIFGGCTESRHRNRWRFGGQTRASPGSVHTSGMADARRSAAFDLNRAGGH